MFITLSGALVQQIYDVMPKTVAAFLKAWQRLSESEMSRILAQIQAAKTAGKRLVLARGLRKDAGSLEETGRHSNDSFEWGQQCHAPAPRVVGVPSLTIAVPANGKTLTCAMR